MQTLAIVLYPNAWDTFIFMMTGFVVVIGILYIMSLFTSIIGLPFKKMNEKAAQKAQDAKKKPFEQGVAKSNAKNSEISGVIASAVYAALDGAPHRIVSARPAGEISPEIVAVISAAATMALGDAHCRVVSIKQATPDFNWASSGRSAIFASKSPKR